MGIKGELEDLPHTKKTQRLPLKFLPQENYPRKM